MPSGDSNRLTRVPCAADLRQVDDLLEKTTLADQTNWPAIDGNADDSRLQQRSKILKGRPPRLPVKIIPNAQPSKLTKTNSFLSHEDPWKQYWGVWERDRAGTGILAYKNVESFPFVFIKKRPFPGPNGCLQHLKAISHANIVHLREAFVSGESVYFVYDAMRVSLSQLHGSPYVSFNEADIATVLDGVKHIHDDLQISHGSLSCDNILLTEHGRIQIANIGESLLEATTDTDGKQHDVRAVGLIAVQLKERHTGLDDPDTLVLREPQNASAEVKDFIQRSSMASSHMLLRHEFLLKSPGSWCLKPYILEAEPYINAHYRHIHHNDR
ncbi:hypothetical protein FQN50_009137 [Emmonsiellopsis sp. PD_5]|nr:hypothetical protein FQN50_009137 [Emmonsiellopsis sp. PD_5]